MQRFYNTMQNFRNKHSISLEKIEENCSHFITCTCVKCKKILSVEMITFQRIWGHRMILVVVGERHTCWEAGRTKASFFISSLFWHYVILQNISIYSFYFLAYFTQHVHKMGFFYRISHISFCCCATNIPLILKLQQINYTVI